MPSARLPTGETCSVIVSPGGHRASLMLLVGRRSGCDIGSGKDLVLVEDAEDDARECAEKGWLEPHTLEDGDTAFFWTPEAEITCGSARSSPTPRTGRTDAPGALADRSRAPAAPRAAGDDRGGRTPPLCPPCCPLRFSPAPRRNHPLRIRRSARDYLLRRSCTQRSWSTSPSSSAAS